MGEDPIAGTEAAVLGIDIGGSGVKGATVDPARGMFTADRVRVETPRPAGVAELPTAVAAVAERFPGTGRIGVAFPGVVSGGVTLTAANLDPTWRDAPASKIFSAALGRPVTLVNDADAAGLAEMRFGAGHGQPGVTIMLTFGTGIGSAVFLDGRLLPNTELGHLELHGQDAELWASDRVRETARLDWPSWAGRVQDYLRHLDLLLQPDLLIVGGGVSKKAHRFLPLIECRAPVVPAALQNNAGIIGAALAAAAAAAAADQR